MSIKSDAYLIKKCTPPSHRAIVSGLKSGFGWLGVDFQLADCTDDGRVRVHSTLYVPVEPADLDSFYLQNPWFPLIAPFFGEQVRSKEVPRTMSPQEELYHRTLPLEEQTAYRASLTATEKTISYGVSSYGYDVQCAEEFKVFTNINNSLIDPKNFDPAIFVDVKGPKCIIPPNSFALARTVEWFKIPRNVLTVCLGKSTYARCGIIVNVTPLEPEWEGHVTLEFSNTTNLPAVIYANEGVAQMLFFESDETCLTSYKDRGGKYQGQSGVVVPRMK